MRDGYVPTLKWCLELQGMCSGHCRRIKWFVGFDCLSKLQGWYLQWSWGECVLRLHRWHLSSFDGCSGLFGMRCGDVCGDDEDQGVYGLSIGHLRFKHGSERLSGLRIRKFLSHQGLERLPHV